MTITSPLSMQKSCKKGFTLTEIAIVLGIIGLILGAVWTAASGVYLSANANKFQQQMGQYLVAARAYCSNNACAASTALPTLTQAVPTIAPATIGTGANAPTTTASADGFTVAWVLPTNSKNACLSIGNAISTMTGSTVADTAAHASTYLTPVASSTCSGAGATPTCPAATATLQYSAIANSCTSATGSSGACVASFIPSGYCTSATTLIAGGFSLTY